MWNSFYSLRAKLRFSDYKPQGVTFASTMRWINQFPPEDRRTAGRLLENVIYLSEAKTRQILVEQNAALVKRLTESGLKLNQLIYVQVHDAGSSSPVMLNILRDAAQLERRGCRFVDARDSIRLNKATNEVGEGAIIYIDDFVGTGNQFCEERDFVAQSIVGTFSEFILVPSICEEAIYKIAARGVEAFAGHVHSKAERPLHANSTLLDSASKERMKEVCRGISPRFGLGYKDLATMVVLYRNAPNTVPIIFRGNLNQKPFAGIFPRTTDLPLKKVG